jgi:hypothetical protein
MYLINVIIFNELHLRRKKERLGWQLLYVYYLPYKIVLTFINVASCYWSVHTEPCIATCYSPHTRSLYKYARYFAKRHPKVIEDEKAIEVIIRLEEDSASTKQGLGRSMTIRAVASNTQGDAPDDEAVSPMATVPQGTIRSITAPEPVHARTDERTLEREGVAARDYFFGPNQTVQEEKMDEKKEEV